MVRFHLDVETTLFGLLSIRQQPEFLFFCLQMKTVEMASPDLKTEKKILMRQTGWHRHMDGEATPFSGVVN